MHLFLPSSVIYFKINMKKLIVVADWAADGLTSQQVRSTIEGYLQHNDNPNINFIPVSFSTLHGGFVSSQVIEIEERNGRPLDTVLYVGVDPKEADTFSAIFMIARLKSGLIICGPNNGLNFSFIKQKIDEIFIYKGLEEKMFFRSRDLYARVIAHLMEAMEDEMDIEETHTNLIPALLLGKFLLSTKLQFVAGHFTPKNSSGSIFD